MKRLLVPTSSPYGDIGAFSRAVRVGNHVSVAGTAPLDEAGRTVGPDDPEAQARQCYEIVKIALEAAGASLHDVVRTRTLLTRIDDWEVVSRVRAEYFANTRPVDTIVEVSRFIRPEWLVEIEVDAVIAL